MHSKVLKRRKVEYVPDTNLLDGNPLQKDVVEARKRTDDVWWFVYRPKASVAVKLPGWRLTYDLRGLPFVEPSFADIEPLLPGDTTPEVQGVCHQITLNEWRGIVATEGGGGVLKHGYHTIEVNPIPLRGDKAPIKSVTLSVGPDPVIKFRDNQLHLPSRRYLKLLTEGAQYYELESAYVQWLESHQCYMRHEHVTHKWLFYLIMTGLVFLALPILIVFAINSLIFRKLPYNVSRKVSFVTHSLAFVIGRIVWYYHDALHWIFGPLGWITVHKGGSKNVKCAGPSESSLLQKTNIDLLGS